MTKAAALQSFMGSFGLDAYPVTAIDEGTTLTFPFLTYEPIFDTFDGGKQTIPVSLYYLTESELEPNAKAEEMLEKMGTRIRCDKGLLWFTKGTPWCQSLSDDNNKEIKIRHINIDCEYLTI